MTGIVKEIQDQMIEALVGILPKIKEMYGTGELSIGSVSGPGLQFHVIENDTVVIGRITGQVKHTNAEAVKIELKYEHFKSSI